MHIVVDGLLTDYRLSGKGPLVLFLHGWGDSQKTFDGLVNAFEKQYSCLRLDLPGFGGSEVPHQAWTLSAYAAFVQHFLEKLHLTPAVLVGHSNGGAVALKGIENGQLTPKKLVLLSASGIRPKKTFKTTLITLGAKTGKQFVKILPKAKQRALRKTLYSRLGSDYLAAPQMAETFKKVVREDVREDLHRVTIPVLLVYGEDDADTPLWIAYTFQKMLPKATLHTSDGAGHFVHHDDLAGTVQSMKDFLK